MEQTAGKGIVCCLFFYRIINHNYIMYINGTMMKEATCIDKVFLRVIGNILNICKMKTIQLIRLI